MFLIVSPENIENYQASYYFYMIQGIQEWTK